MKKDLEKIYESIPKASSAWKLDQLMNQRCLAEMPNAYKIKSVFDFDEKARSRVKTIMEPRVY